MNDDDNTLSFGFVTGGSVEELQGFATLPISSLWVGGHIAAPSPTPEPLISLAAMAAITSTPVIGTAILPLPLYPPAIVAKQVAEIDRLSGGRVQLGIGVAGEFPGEFDACGVPVTERGSRTDEIIPLLRRLWSGEAIEHHGRYFDFGPVKISPPPFQPSGPPIIVAGRSAAAIRRAALLGDGWMPYSYSVDRYARSVAEIHAIAAERGRDLRTFSWDVHLFVNVGDDASGAVTEAARYLAGFYGDQAFPLEKAAAVGTPADVAARLSAYAAVGARNFVLVPCSEDPLRVARRIVNDVVPLVG